ncbi:MAG TPA: hypothetical protein VFA20_17030 [Myxococcaceae bacterium]|nr:hypothetical protein [Myxococcaceae bacterium]
MGRERREPGPVRDALGRALVGMSREHPPGARRLSEVLRGHDLDVQVGPERFGVIGAEGGVRVAGEAPARAISVSLSPGSLCRMLAGETTVGRELRAGELEARASIARLRRLDVALRTFLQVAVRCPSLAEIAATLRARLSLHPEEPT